MIKERWLLLILAAIQFTHIMDFMIIMPLGSQFMRVFDISPQQFSMIVSAYAISAFFFGLFSSMYIDRFDRKTALLINYIGFTLGTLACSFAPTYEIFLLARSLTGAFGGVLGALVLAVIGDVIPLHRRSSAMGMVMTAFSVASIAGVPLGIFLAATFTWQAPFIFVGSIAVVLTFLIVWLLPGMDGHMQGQKTGEKTGRDPFRAMINAVQDVDQRRALLFTLVLMLGHFTIIPFIAPYMQLNIGFSDYEVTYIYMVGGALTVFLLPLFGKISDRLGNARVFTLASFFAVFSIFAITNLPPVSIVLALCATSSFFVVASGRNVPATTMITAVVRPENRGSFMSIRSSVNEMALALSSFVAGSIIIEKADGSLGNYAYVGYIAIIMSILAIVVARSVRVVETREVKK